MNSATWNPSNGGTPSTPYAEGATYPQFKAIVALVAIGVGVLDHHFWPLFGQNLLTALVDVCWHGFNWMVLTCIPLVEKPLALPWFLKYPLPDLYLIGIGTCSAGYWRLLVQRGVLAKWRWMYSHPRPDKTPLVDILGWVCIGVAFVMTVVTLFLLAFSSGKGSGLTSLLVIYAGLAAYFVFNNRPIIEPLSGFDWIQPHPAEPFDRLVSIRPGIFVFEFDTNRSTQSMKCYEQEAIVRKPANALWDSFVAGAYIQIGRNEMQAQVGLFDATFKAHFSVQMPASNQHPSSPVPSCPVDQMVVDLVRTFSQIGEETETKLATTFSIQLAESEEYKKVAAQFSQLRAELTDRDKAYKEHAKKLKAEGIEADTVFLEFDREQLITRSYDLKISANQLATDIRKEQLADKPHELVEVRFIIEELHLKPDLETTLDEMVDSVIKSWKGLEDVRNTIINEALAKEERAKADERFRAEMEAERIRVALQVAEQERKDREDRFKAIGKAIKYLDREEQKQVAESIISGAARPDEPRLIPAASQVSSSPSGDNAALDLDSQAPSDRKQTVLALISELDPAEADQLAADLMQVLKRRRDS